MKSNERWMVALAVVLGASLSMTTAFGQSLDAQQRAAEAARAKDPAWKPACTEVATIQAGDGKGSLKNFCLDAKGNILACYAPATAKNSDPKKAQGIRVFSPDGNLLKTMPLDIKPSAICVAKDGSIFAAGDGKLLKLDAEGKVLASVASPVASQQVVMDKDTLKMVEDMCKETKQPVKDATANMKLSLEKRRTDVTGLAATEQDVFMAVPSPTDFTYRVYRFDHELKNQKLVVEKLRGCCSQMDIQAANGNLWIPHNSRHAVESHDRDGKELLKFGTAGRVKASDFGGCCEPKNMRVLANGDILAAESGPPTCIKRFSSTGKFKEVVAVANAKGDCVRVTVEMSPDGSRYYMLDTQRDVIRVFKSKT